MSPIAEVVDATAAAAHLGLSSSPKTLPPWLFYDEAGSQLFEQITALPEYYLTRTERILLEQHVERILELCGPVSLVELGAGTATKTGILLAAAARAQQTVLYQPIDVSPSALAEARESLEAAMPGLTVRPQIANYITEPIHIHREPRRNLLALYIGSSIGNFSPAEACAILTNLRAQLRPGDHLLLGTDLAPNDSKPVARLLAAYDDLQGVTAAFNLNILARLNRELDADFDLDCFVHQARWSATHSRIEMHLASLTQQSVRLPANAAGPAVSLRFQLGETIHTENSYKFTSTRIAALLDQSGFHLVESFTDAQQTYAVSLAAAA